MPVINTQDMRFGSMFGPQSFSPPDFSAGAMNPDTINSIINQNRDRQMQREMQMQEFQRQGRLEDISKQIAIQRQQPQEANTSQQGPNVRYIPPISEYQKGMLNLGQEKVDVSQERAGTAKTQGQEKIDITAQNNKMKNDIASFKAQNPGMKIMADNQGNLTGINPVTGQSMNLGQHGLDRNSLQDLKNQGILDDIDYRAGAASDLESQRNQDRMGQIGAQIAGRKDLQSTKPETPQQTGVDLFNKAQQYVNQNPDMAQHIKLDPSTKTFTVAAPNHGGWFSSGPSLSDWNKINDSIYGKPKSQQPNPSPSTSSTPSQPDNSDPLGIRGQ